MASPTSETNQRAGTKGLRIALTLLIITILTKGSLTSTTTKNLFNQPPFNQITPKTKLKTKVNNQDLLASIISQIHKNYKKKAKSLLSQLLKNEQKSERDPKQQPFPCTRGRDPSKLTNSAYLKAFAAGPCSPVVAVPGIAASKLRAIIDCDLLQKSSPEIFSACGWSTCSQDPTSQGFAPNSEYELWFPNLLSPFSLVIPTEATRKCFAGIFGQMLANNGTSSVNTEPRPGVKVVPIGSSPETNTFKFGKCGFDSVEDLMPWPLRDEKFSYYLKLKESLLGAGYKIGLSAQALPYDWRVGTNETQLSSKFGQIVDTMASIFGKKVTIVAHSLGNFQVVNYLWSTSQAVKDRDVARYLAIAPPFLGAPKSAMKDLGMDTTWSYTIDHKEVGVTPEIYRDTIVNLRSVYNLYVTGTYTADAGEAYMQGILGRIAAEKQNSGSKSPGFLSFLPAPSEVCVPGLKNRGTANCHLGLFNMTEYGRVVGEAVTPYTAFDVLKAYSYSQNAPYLLNKGQDTRFTTLPNPGVQTNIIYSTSVPTLKHFTYNKDPRTKTLKNEVYHPEKRENGMGDGVVLTTSALTAGVKWAYDFYTKIPGSKPVNFVELCGTLGIRGSVFEPGSADKQVTKNAYYGVDCTCKGTAQQPQTGYQCTSHGDMVTDDKLVEFLVASANDGVAGQVGPNWAFKTEFFWADFVGNCRLFNGLKKSSQEKDY